MRQFSPAWLIVSSALAMSLGVSSALAAPTPAALLATEAPDRPDVGQRLTEALTQAIESDPALTLTQPATMKLDEAKLTFSCFDEAPACMRDIAGLLDARRLAWASVARTSDGWLLRVRVLDAAAGRLVGEGDFGLRGGDEQIAELLRLAEAVVRGEQPVVRQNTRLVVESTPPGAQVALDGRPFGPTPVEVEVESGAHQIALSMQGYAPVLHRVDAQDPTVRVLLELVPVVPVAAPPVTMVEPVQPVEPRDDWRFWAGVGTGGVAVVAAGVAVGLYATGSGNADDAKGLPADDPRRQQLLDDHDRYKAGYYTALTLSLTAAAASAVFFVLDATDDGPSLAATANGAMLQGRF
ncbi:MAG: PEGA domain-containing protein [Myxococcales bacterium]|nr:PEGA domain-containing protein [Myxococcales bacterium]